MYITSENSSGIDIGSFTIISIAWKGFFAKKGGFPLSNSMMVHARLQISHIGVTLPLVSMTSGATRY